MPNRWIGASLAGLLALVAASCQAQSPVAGGGGGASPSPSPTASATPAPANEGDRAFIDGMVPHHELALMMADDALAKGDRTEIKQFAQKMKDDQSQEIAELRQYRQQWFGSATTPAANHGEMKMIPDDADFDAAWAEEVAMHHQMAIDMAERALRDAARPETKAMAQEIIDKQRAEQTQLRAWATAWRQQRADQDQMRAGN